jgi:hypothetical protein
MTRAIKTFERIKRATTYQIRREQKFVQVMHRDQTKNRVAQQLRDSRQAFSESDVKRSRSIFRIQRQN